MTMVICPVCGKEFHVMPSQVGKRITCSNECKGLRHAQRVASGEILVGYTSWGEDARHSIELKRQIMELERVERLARVQERQDKRIAKALAAEEKERKRQEWLHDQEIALRASGKMYDDETLETYMQRINRERMQRQA